MTLEVSSCDGIKMLMTHPTAKSMKRLTRMSITKCPMIQEIIVCEGQDVKEVITFDELKVLQLGDLQNLLSFCSGSSIVFQFPSLGKVVVSRCPSMRSFSQQKVVAPKLKGVHIDKEDEGRWDGNFENTIQQIFREK
ncbi:cc-nbs-lrr resistance protein, partial [Corchorus olitorius]